MTARKRPVSPAQQDLAESERRAKAAKTPIAKAVTKRVLETKRRAYSGQAAREASVQMRRGDHPVAVGTGKAAPETVNATGTKKTKGAARRRG